MIGASHKKRNGPVQVSRECVESLRKEMGDLIVDLALERQVIVIKGEATA